MKEHQHEGLPVKGYQSQSQAKVDAVNHNKELEEVILRVLDSMKTSAEIDQQWLAIGRAHMEEGFMAINRAIFKPGRVKLPTDPDMLPTSGATASQAAATQAPPPAKQSDIVA